MNGYLGGHAVRASLRTYVEIDPRCLDGDDGEDELFVNDFWMSNRMFFNRERLREIVSVIYIIV